ncbi:MAG: hypothetical protein RL090_1745, partial [Bacteroidota bacterium]
MTSRYPGNSLARLLSGFRFMICNIRFWVLTLWLFSVCTKASFGQDSTSTEAPRETKIALVMSFEVNRNVGIDPVNPESPGIHPLSLPALHFYEGARLAVDSISRKGSAYNLTCFESPTDSSGMDRLL